MPGRTTRPLGASVCRQTADCLIRTCPSVSAACRLPRHTHRVGGPEDWSIDEAELWCSGQPRFGTVRAVIIDGDYAIVLDDLNSDYRETELTGYRRAGRRWHWIFDQQDAGFPAVGHSYRWGWSASESGGYAWIFGREDPGATVQLRYRGEPVQVVADAGGWWMCIRETTDNADHVLELEF